MALNVVLICLFAVSCLNVLLIYDLYGRSARLAKYADEVSKITRSMKHNIDRITSSLGITP